MEEEREEACSQCGLCCRVFGPKVVPTPFNILGWMEAGRTDILKHFSACMKDGRRVNCSILKPEEIGDIIIIDMRDPKTGEYPAVCPFLRRPKRDRYLCAIHEHKPDMCGNYEPWIWGETFFPKCPALRKKNTPNNPGSG